MNARKDKKQRESPELELLWVRLDTQPWSWSWHNFVFLARSGFLRKDCLVSLIAQMLDSSFHIHLDILVKPKDKFISQVELSS